VLYNIPLSHHDRSREGLGTEKGTVKTERYGALHQNHNLSETDPALGISFLQEKGGKIKGRSTRSREARARQNSSSSRENCDKKQKCHHPDQTGMEDKSLPSCLLIWTEKR